jgi:hypothetical protein
MRECEHDGIHNEPKHKIYGCHNLGKKGNFIIIISLRIIAFFRLAIYNNNKSFFLNRKNLKYNYRYSFSIFIVIVLLRFG